MTADVSVTRNMHKHQEKEKYRAVWNLTSSVIDNNAINKLTLQMGIGALTQTNGIGSIKRFSLTVTLLNIYGTEVLVPERS